MDFVYGLAHHKTVYIKDNIESGDLANRIVSIFGLNCDLEPTNDLYSIQMMDGFKSIIAKKITTTTSAPAPRYDHSAALLPKCKTPIFF